jgi:hypothetical protein
MPPRKIIYIAGLGHSGSTILDMLLSTTRRAVGLGQVWTVLREKRAISGARICSCGAPAPQCDFWGPVINELHKSTAPSHPGHRYRLVLDRVDEMYGAETAVIDSSKQVTNLPSLIEDQDNVDLRVLHNIKDVRAFTVSTLDNEVRKQRRSGIPELIFYEWYRGNRMVERQATQLLARPPLRIMYEALCFATDHVVRQITGYLGGEYIDTGGDLNAGHTHIISGNRARLPGSASATKLSYDHRWFARTEWLRPYLIMAPIRRYNEQCLREWSLPCSAPAKSSSGAQT